MHTVWGSSYTRATGKNYRSILMNLSKLVFIAALTLAPAAIFARQLPPLASTTMTSTSARLTSRIASPRVSRVVNSPLEKPHVSNIRRLASTGKSAACALRITATSPRRTVRTCTSSRTRSPVESIATSTTEGSAKATTWSDCKTEDWTNPVLCSPCNKEKRALRSSSAALFFSC